ncbi:hypothetical protein [Lacinutrix sp. Hel_I_90]|uniref:hypothetical protein n=1 Tax=Lacinutrix sp. Hel_I_90 TaxID=1249999 RepID=UPI0005CA9CD9|nr:hypothetical protein [Lacinutrix sp. Hel_I_90]
MALQDLISLISLLLIILIVLWAFIAYSIVYRVLKTKQQSNLKIKTIDAIALHFLNPNAVHITENKKWLKQKQAKNHYWLIASVFLKVNNVLLTAEANSLKTMATDSGVIPLISKDLKSVLWYKKAKAIMFCYEFGLNEYINSITPYRNHKNVLVRREAQIALVVLLGWKSLKLFPYIEYPISLWQQIRIIEKLKQYHPIAQEKYLQKALMTKNPYVKELLIRIIRTFKLEVYKYYIIKQLYTKDVFLVESALVTLSSFQLNKYEIEEIATSASNIIATKLRIKTLSFLNNQRIALTQSL